MTRVMACGRGCYLRGVEEGHEALVVGEGDAADGLRGLHALHVLLLHPDHAPPPLHLRTEGGGTDATCDLGVT